MSTANFPRYSPSEVVHHTGIEACSIDELHAQEMAPSVIYELHRGNFYHIFRYTEEDSVHYVEDNKLIMGANSLLFINQNILHRYSHHQNQGSVLLFSNAFLGNTQEKVDYINNSPLFQQKYLIIPAPSEPSLHVVDQCHAFIKKMQPDKKASFAEEPVNSMPPHHAIMLRNWLHILLLEVEREYHTAANLLADNSVSYYLQQFHKLLNEHYQLQKQVSFYAATLGVTEKKLSNMVRSVYGLSAKEYICEKILQEANWHLKYTTLSQGEIADKLGFDSTYFVKFFQKYAGVTPAKFRTSVRAITLQANTPFTEP